jgi:hypothetical protein
MNDIRDDPNFKPDVDAQGNFIMDETSLTLLLRSAVLRARENVWREVCEELKCGEVVVLRRSDWELIRVGKYKKDKVDFLEVVKP